MTPAAIQTIRRAMSLTQAQMAEVLRVNRGTIIRWEAGTTAPLPSLVEVLKSLQRRYVYNKRRPDGYQKEAATQTEKATP